MLNQKVVIKQSAKIDPLLEPLLLPITEESVDELLLQLLITHVEPVIKGVVHSNIHPNARYAKRQADASDIYQEIIVQVLAVLRRFREQSGAYLVSDIRGLTAIIAYRTCSRWVTRQFPKRQAFKNHLYYLLTRQRGFALWQGENKRLTAGFALWRGQKVAATEERLKQLSDDDDLLPRIRSLKSGKQAGWGDTLAAIFDCLGGPVEFDRLVGALAALLQIEDQPIESTDQIEDIVEIEASNRQMNLAWQVEMRIFLQRLWEEVCQLPLNQRLSLLLNLRGPDGQGCISLLPELEIATLRQLADTLEMNVETLAEIWNELPLEDAKIAKLLRITRQQVINARKSARERLTRRLRGLI